MSQGPDRSVARQLRLREPPPRAARLSRKALLLGAGAVSLAVAAAAGWGLQARRPSAPASEPVAAAATPPEDVTSLPKDYAGLPAGTPRLGPPLPGDLGRPILQSRGGVQADSSADVGKPFRADPELERRRQALDAARRSELFGGSRGQVAAVSAGPSPLQQPPLELDAIALAQPDRLAAFLAAGRPTGTVSAERLSASPPHALLAGTVIRAALVTGIRSDLPGLVTAQVTEDVFDTVTGRTLLIPQGSRLVGTYDHQVSFGQTRVLLAWTRLILPDGRSILLGREPAADAQGFAGLSDGVDRHSRQLLGAAAISTLLGVGAQLGAGDGDSEVIDALREGFAGSANQVGQQLVGKSLDVQPTLTIRPGYPVRVLLSKDLVLEPYGRTPWGS
jgi:type IV secretion system protein VirB10